jgi:hypothetical protein
MVLQQKTPMIAPQRTGSVGLLRRSDCLLRRRAKCVSRYLRLLGVHGCATGASLAGSTRDQGRVVIGLGRDIGLLASSRGGTASWTGGRQVADGIGRALIAASSSAMDPVAIAAILRKWKERSRCRADEEVAGVEGGRGEREPG